MTLTINIDEKKLQKVRSIVERDGGSLEKLFEIYLDSFLKDERIQPDTSDKYNQSLKERFEVVKDKLEFKGKSPIEIVKELTKNIKIPSDLDEKEDYHQHIMRKHA